MKNKKFFTLYFRRKNTPHYKRDIQVDHSIGSNLLLDATPNLDLKAQPEVSLINVKGVADANFLAGN
jgi:hypothetical protein